MNCRGLDGIGNKEIRKGIVVMRKMYRAKIKEYLRPKEAGGLPFSEDKELVLRNGIFDDDGEEKELSRHFGIGDKDIFTKLRINFQPKSNGFICSDKAQQILQDSISPDSISFAPLEKFPWEKLVYFNGPTDIALVPSVEFPSVSQWSKIIHSIDDIEIE